MGKVADKIAAAPDDPDAELKSLDADARVALLRKENKKLRDRLRQRDEGWDIVEAALKEAYSEPLDIRIEKPRTQSKKLKHEEAVLHWTDLHFGKETRTYNSTVAAERLRECVQAVHEITELRRSFARITRCTIQMGGDFGEGEGEIFPGQAHEIDQDLIEQFIKFGPEQVSAAILSLLQTFDELQVNGVPGNHGRQGRFAAKRNNADSVMYEVVRHIVNAAAGKDAKRITWNLPLDRPRGNEWYAISEVCGRWRVLLVHGDQIKGQLGFPWYGVGKKVGGWIQALGGFDFMFMGHFHTHAAFDLNRVTVMATGSQESDNSYAAENMAASGAPKQRLCFMNHNRGLIADHAIHLGGDA